MQVEVITKREDLVIRRLVQEPGEATPWHTDSCHRFSVVVRGEELRIEFGETGEHVSAAVHPGMSDWDKPDARIHRGVNARSIDRRLPVGAKLRERPAGEALRHLSAPRGLRRIANRHHLEEPSAYGRQSTPDTAAT